MTPKSDLERCRAIVVEGVFGLREWTSPFHENEQAIEAVVDFEHAIVEDTLAGANVVCTAEGLYLHDPLGDADGATVGWETLVEQTIAFWTVGGGDHPEDRADTVTEARAIADQLRAAADQIERALL